MRIVQYVDEYNNTVPQLGPFDKIVGVNSAFLNIEQTNQKVLVGKHEVVIGYVRDSCDPSNTTTVRPTDLYDDIHMLTLKLGEPATDIGLLVIVERTYFTQTTALDIFWDCCEGECWHTERNHAQYGPNENAYRVLYGGYLALMVSTVLANEEYSDAGRREDPGGHVYENYFSKVTKTYRDEMIFLCAPNNDLLIVEAHVGIANTLVKAVPVLIEE